VRRVTRSALVDLYRREHPPLEPITTETEETVAAESRDVAERIDDLFSALNPDEQRLMRMRLDGYSAEEIADELEIEANAVYQRVNRIMNKLRKYGTRL
jgi:RNA polymerase sigma factor (sigma-70 family)